MTGNVWEWTIDDSVYYGGKVIRGGSWNNNNVWSLSADYRYDSHPDDRLDNVGFRCVAPPQ